MKANNIYGSLGLYGSYVAGILNSVEKIHFYVVCNEQLNYADYIEKCIAGKDCCISHKSHTGSYFRLSSGGQTIAVSFEDTLIHGQIPSEIILHKVC